MKLLKMKSHSRRTFIKITSGGAVGLALFPTIIPSRLLGAGAPSKKIHVAQIGCGRMGRADMSSMLALYREWPRQYGW